MRAIANNEPEYIKIYKRLVNDLKGGKYPVGAPFPGDKELTASYAVNHLTVRSALRLLVDDGCIVRRRGRGKGTTVVRMPLEGDFPSVQKTRTVAVFLPGVDKGSPNSEFLRGIERVLPVDRYRIHPVYDEWGEAVEKDGLALDKFLGGALDGLLMFGSFRAETLQRQLAHARRLDRFGVPLVVIDRPEIADVFDCVSVDDKLGARMAVDHLAAMGHKALLYVTYENPSLRHKVRLEGFQEAAALAGVTSEVLFIPSDRQKARVSLGDNRRIFKKFTGCVCGNNSIADTLILFLEKAGMKVPADIAVMGYDDLPPHYIPLVSSNISSVERCRSEVGRLAALRIRSRFEDSACPRGVRSLVAPRLVIRGSCGGKRDEEMTSSILEDY